MATRQASQAVLEAVVPLLPELIGGSADLTGSNNTLVKDMGVVGRGDFAGRYLHYGVREFAMAAAMNGMALHGGLIPYGGTFLVFTDYCRPAIRLSALMHRRVIYVMTHDSIGLGEDGPTHQPVEHLASLRAMPGLLVLRPCDLVETAECWQIALESRDRPTVLALTRQALPLARTSHSAENLSAKGAYVVSPAEGAAAAVLIATGSEVEIALAAQRALAGHGIQASVVSMPCQGLFDAQPASYRQAVLPPGALKVAIEAASAYGWDRYVGPDGIIIAMTSFGASAPHKDLYTHFQITPEAVTAAVRERLGR
jgi:transketolase